MVGGYGTCMDFPLPTLSSLPPRSKGVQLICFKVRMSISPTAGYLELLPPKDVFEQLPLPGISYSKKDEYGKRMILFGFNVTPCVPWKW